MARWIIALLLCSPLTWAEQSGRDDPGADQAEEVRPRVYRIIGEDGSVRFTDNPEHRGAVEVEVREKNVIPMTPVRRAPPATEPPAATPDYQVAVTSPDDQATLRNPESISVGFSVSPEVASGHRVRLLHNGEVLGGALINRPDRGAHRLQAQVVDAEDRVLAESTPVTVYVHRTSVNQPASR